GQAIYAYVMPMHNATPSDELLAELKAYVSEQVGAFAKPDFIQWAHGLPKTRSGKIMRRILRKIACDELDTLGDTSTLADPSVVEELIEHRLNRAT
ncbi:MAG: acetyl-coenzyme A synthetase, partial [Pseudomonas sp.]